MRILVAGSSGRVGARLIALLAKQGHDVVAASRSSGIDVVSGSGLDAALAGVHTVIDVTNAPTRDAEEISRFFEAASRHMMAAGRRSGCAHHIALSVVGADRMAGSPYMRGKIAQERVVAEGNVPFTIVRATQFFEFIAQFPDIFGEGDSVRLPAGLMRPIAVDDVASALAAVAGRSPANGVVELGGPRVMAIRDAVADILDARGDRRRVTASEKVSYFGASLRQDTLVPGPTALRGTTDLDAWIRMTPAG